MEPRAGLYNYHSGHPSPRWTPRPPTASGADQDEVGDRQEFNLQILDILSLQSSMSTSFLLPLLIVVEI